MKKSANNWSYDDLTLFTVLVEKGSFVAAAEKLSLPPSTVSRRLKNLESGLRAKLIERSSRKMRLTQRGRELYQQSAPLLAQLQKNTSDFVNKEGSMAGKLVISTSHFINSQVLAVWLAEFMAVYPELELNLKVSNRNQDIIEEDIDLAIRIAGQLKDSEMVARLLYKPTFVFCATAGFYQKKPNAGLTDLQSIACWLPSYWPDNWKVRSKKTGVESNLVLNARYCSDDPSLPYAAARQGLGASIFADFSVQSELANGQLVNLLPEYEIVSENAVYALYPSRQHLPEKTSRLILFLHRSLSISHGIINLRTSQV